MRKSKALWAAVVLTAGCASPRQPVYVDLTHVELPAQLDPSLFDRSAPPRAKGRSGSLAIGSAPAREIDHKALRQKEVDLLGRVETIRKESVVRLRDELFRIYTKQVERRRAAKESDIRQEFLALLESTHLKVTREFEIYTRQRWPLLSQLAAIVGFPIPPRERLQVPPETQKWERREFERAVGLYRQLEDVKAAYEAKVVTFHDEARSNIAQRRVEEGVKLANELDRLGVQAAELAELAVKSADSAIDLVLDEQPKFVLDRIAGEQLSVSVESPALPNIESNSSSTRDIISAREKLEALLKIWADSNGFQLVGNPQMGVNETQRFKQWIEQRVGGL